MSDGNRERPTPRARVVIDPDNAYARLGVSPLLGVEEIKRAIKERSNKLRQAARREGSSEGTDEIVELERIEREIGTVKARAAYDLRHPQNELLVVQPSSRDRSVESTQRVGIVGQWVLEALGDDAPVLSASSSAWWTTGGVSDALREALAPFVVAEVPAATEREGPRGLDVEELDALGSRANNREKAG